MSPRYVFGSEIRRFTMDVSGSLSSFAPEASARAGQSACQAVATYDALCPAIAATSPKRLVTARDDEQSTELLTGFINGFGHERPLDRLFTSSGGWMWKAFSRCALYTVQT
jgi:hypothetical protein